METKKVLFLPNSENSFEHSDQLAVFCFKVLEIKQVIIHTSGQNKISPAELSGMP